VRANAMMWTILLTCGSLRNSRPAAGAPLALIAGPCVIESEEHVHFLAREIAKIAGTSSQGIL